MQGKLGRRVRERGKKKGKKGEKKNTGIILTGGRFRKMHALKQKGGWRELPERQQRGRGWMTYCGFFHKAGFEPLFDAI